MFTVFRRYKGKRTAFEVLTPEEASARGIYFVPWRLVREAGQWVLTDDNWVTVCVRLSDPYTEKHSAKRTRRQITVPFTRKFISKQPLRWLDYMKPSWIHQELKTTRAKTALSMYARLLVARDGKLTPEDWKMLGLMYRPDQKIPEATFKRLLKMEETKTMVGEELARVLNELGIDHAKVIQMYKEAFVTAQETGQAAAMRSVAKDLSEMLDMKPDKRKATAEFEVEIDLAKLAQEHHDVPDVQIPESTGSGKYLPSSTGTGDYVDGQEYVVTSTGESAQGVSSASEGGATTES